MIITILGYMMSKAYMAFVFGSIGGEAFKIENFFGGNIVLFITLLALFFLTIIIFSFLSYLFPLVYMSLYEDRGNFDFTTKDIGDRLKADIGRTIKFTFLTLLMTMTIGLFVMALFVVVCITIIGIPFVAIGFFAWIAIYNIAFFAYINNRSLGYIDSFKVAFEFVKNNLWPVVGSNFAMLVLVQIVSSVVTMIPMMMAMGSFISNIESKGGDMADTTGVGVAMGITMALSLLVSYVLHNFIIINNGMIYYTMLETNHSHHVKSEIDLIGTAGEF